MSIFHVEIGFDSGLLINYKALGKGLFPDVAEMPNHSQKMSKYLEEKIKRYYADFQGKLINMGFPIDWDGFLKKKAIKKISIYHRGIISESEKLDESSLRDYDQENTLLVIDQITEDEFHQIKSILKKAKFIGIDSNTCYCHIN